MLEKEFSYGTDGCSDGDYKEFWEVELKV